MVNNPEAVAFIYTLAGITFLIGLFVGAVSTLARVVYYRIHGTRRPRLLTRDVLVYGGLALSFGLIAGVRLLPLDVRLALTTGNVGWALATSVPAVIAVIVYCYFELAVIERARGGE